MLYQIIKKKNCKYVKFKKLHEKYSNCCYDVILIKYSSYNYFFDYLKKVDEKYNK